MSNEIALAAFLIVAVPIVVWVLARIVFTVYFQAKRRHTKNVLHDIESKPSKPDSQ